MRHDRIADSTNDAGSADNGRVFAAHAARLLADSRCEQVVVLDLHQISQVTDYFVIASGTSERQLRSVAEDVRKLAKAEGHDLFRRHGEQIGEWVVLDFVDVVVHLFLPPQRGYYDLEGLWADASPVDWRATTQPGQFSRLIDRHEDKARPSGDGATG